MLWLNNNVLKFSTGYQNYRNSFSQRKIFKKYREEKMVKNRWDNSLKTKKNQ